jgi:hypothetical protein
MRLDVGEQFLLQRQIFGDRLDDIIGLAHRFDKIVAWPNARSGVLVFAKIAQVGGDPILDRAEVSGGCIRDRDLVAGYGEDLRDAVAHKARADDRDAHLRHVQPAVYPPSA